MSQEKRKIRIFDTTLRDGQQCPGAGMSMDLNIEYAKLALEVNVDVMEAGFPSASKGDFEIVHNIAEMVSSSDFSTEIAGLCQLRDKQIDITMEALAPAVKNNKALLHVYVPVSPALMEASLGAKADKSEIVKDTFNFISRASKAGYLVEFSPEGYSMQGENFNFVFDLISAATEAGANIINCPDTIGGAFVGQGEEYFINKINLHYQQIQKKYPQNNLIWSIHCHNDFGLAVQNSINGVLNGPITQIEGCFNGIGERAGNAALESLIMIIDEYGNKSSTDFTYYTQIKIDKLQKISDFIKVHMLPRQPHWPITGDNASRHTSGGHTNAVLTDTLAYQPFDPRRVGNKISLVFGPLSGGNHAKSVIEDRGYICDDNEKAGIAQFIKDMYHERRKGITDDELVLGYIAYRSPITIESFDYARSSTRVSLSLKGRLFDKSGNIEEEFQGKDSALAALKNLIDRSFKIKIISHKSESDREGIEALSISRIVISCVSDSSDNDELNFEGIGQDNDIEISALKALVDAVNKAYVYKNYKRK